MIRYVFLLTVLLSCGPSKVNQYVNMTGKRLRQGLWIEKEKAELGEIVTRGRYDHGERIGKWKTTVDGKTFQIDKIKESITHTKIYWPNGKLMERGQSRLEIKPNERFWYYYGDWKYYDRKGKLIKTKHFDRDAKVGADLSKDKY